MATYTPSVPQAAQTISSTQAPIQSNFQAISDLVAVNHTPFGSNAALPGTHSVITFADQSGVSPFPPNPLQSGQVNLYNSVVSSKAQLYLQYPTGSPIPITSGSAANGYAYLMNGTLMQWGSATFSGSGNVAVTFPVAYSSTVYNIQLTPSGSSSASVYNFIVNTISTTGFGIQVNAPIVGTPQIYWFAIGV